jgi:hypothetical protein
MKLGLILLLVGGAFSLGAQTNRTAAGHWEGSITLPAAPLHIQVDLEQSADQSWKGKISIPAQKVRMLELGSIKVSGRDVEFAMPNTAGNSIFKGELSANGMSMAGEFSQGGQTFPFKLARKTAPKRAGINHGGAGG